MNLPHQLVPPRAAPADRVLAGALFDWDGTLSDSREALLSAWYQSSEQVLGRRFPIDRAEEDLVFTRPGAEIWSTLASDPDEVTRLAEAFRLAYVEAAAAILPFAGIVSALERLRGAGLALGVVTSKTRSRLLEDAERQLIAPLIDVAICAGETSAPKPDAAPVLAALAALQIEPARAAMIGDTPVDIEAGLSAGVLAVGVAWGHATAAELHAAGAVVVAQTPDELVGLLLGEREDDR